MDFSNLWWRAKKRPVQSPAPEPAVPPPSAPRPTAPTAPAPAREAAPASPPPEGSQDLDEVISLFDSIREVMGEEEQEALAELPFRAILAHVPESQRGPAWNPHAIPVGSFAVERKELLRQLADGRIQVALGDVAAVIPHGWLQGDPETLLEVNLPEVIAVIPPEWIRATTEISEELSAVAGMRDYFGPAETEAPPTPGEQPQPATPEELAPPAPTPAPAVPPVAVPAPAAPAARPVPPPEPVAPPAPVPVPPAVAAEPAVPLVTAPPPAPAPPPVTVPAPVPAPAAPAPQPVLPAPAAPVPEAPTQGVPAPVPTRIPVPTAARVRSAAPPARAVTRVAPSAAKPLEGPLWDGVEMQQDAGAAALDLNAATLKELLELPEIGQHRAMLILAERERRGRFSSIYDLLQIPGIGAHVFVQITGLAPSPRQDRHLVLNRLLDLPPEARPPLGQLVKLITAYLGAEGCLLSSQDGMVLACANLEAEQAARQAAFVPQFFRRTNHFLNRLGTGQIATLVLPTKDQTLIMMAPGSIYLLATLAPEGSVDAACQRSRRLCTELAWQLGRRAVVRKQEIYEWASP